MINRFIWKTVFSDFLRNFISIHPDINIADKSGWFLKIFSVSRLKLLLHSET